MFTLPCVRFEAPPAAGGVTVVSAIAQVFAEEAANGTTPSQSVSGTNRAIFGGAFSLNSFGGAPTLTSLEYDGSGGTALTKIGTDETFNSGNAGVAAFLARPGPAGATTTVHGVWSGGVRAGVASVIYSGVNQTTSYDTRTTASGSESGVSTTVASVVVSGISSGDKISAIVAMSSGNNAAAPFTAVSGTALLAEDTEGLGGIAVIEREASGSSVTLQVNANNTGTTTITWRVIAVRLLPA